MEQCDQRYRKGASLDNMIEEILSEDVVSEKGLNVGKDSAGGQFQVKVLTLLIGNTISIYDLQHWMCPQNILGFFFNVCWPAFLLALFIRDPKFCHLQDRTPSCLVSQQLSLPFTSQRKLSVSRDIFLNLLPPCTCSYCFSEAIFFSFLPTSKYVSLPLYIDMFWIPSLPISSRLSSAFNYNFNFSLYTSLLNSA